MILVSLIEKEVIYFFRNKSNVATMFIFPVVLILIMGFSLNGLMNVDKNIFENQKVYYKINYINGDTRYLNIFLSFKAEYETNMKVEFIEIYDEGDGKRNVNNYNGLAYIEINEANYNFYRNEKKESTSQKIFRSIFDNFLERYAVIEEMTIKNPMGIDDLIKEESSIKINESGIATNGISSFAYYTFAELVLIILYISQITSISMYIERFENTLNRLRITKASNLSIITSKIVLGMIIGIIQVIVVYFISRFILKINWGDNLVEIIMVLIALIIFSSILGIAVSLVFKDSKTANSLINSLLIVLGFLGGAYLPISLIKSNIITNILCQITPTYWANISLLSLSSGILTNYPIISVIISLELSLILFAYALIASKRE
ncbi:ABC transporter permease [Clostridium sp. AL.422]|uniref:ABC transporter permease n=1 Tax=Clostridium TaxID=1485 RepID=UPI00293DE9D7|nr:MULTISPECIES: ABC transporter permease [unclassified Clostridium]MDV4151119.1 ABC transporter permease [Clostridium sp. AL.422]